MSNIIKEPALSRRLSHEQVAILTDLERYVLEQRLVLDQQKAAAELEISELKNRLKKENEERIIELSNSICEDNRSKINSFFTKIEYSLSELTSVILDKLGINKFSPEQIRQLISRELSELVSGQTVIIRAHPGIVEELGSRLAGIGNQLIFHEDGSLDIQKCILEFELAVIHINVADCRDAILNIIAPTVDKETAND